jgi:lactobin A/cerein 7B family class IIb bacteriocin
MDRVNVAELMRTNPELMDQGRQQLEGVLTRSATDLDFRAQLVAEPRAALSSFFGHEVADMNIVFIENKVSATIVLPPFVDLSAELSESELEMVAGGSEPVTISLGTACLLVAAGTAIGAGLTGLAYWIASD